MALKALPARKLGLLRWEADVEQASELKAGTTVFTFVGYTKAGAESRAAKFIIERNKEQA